MRCKYLSVLALSLIVSSGSALVPDQGPPHLDRQRPPEVFEVHAQARRSVSDQPNVSVGTTHHRLSSANEATALGAIIPDFRVNDDTLGEDQGWPGIATDSSGDFVITWHDERNGNYDIYAQRYASDGTPSDSNFKVNDDLSTTWQIRPSIATDATGNFVIAWVDARGGHLDIYVQRYASDGTPLDSNFRVNDDTLTAMQDHPSIAADGNGNFVITWVDSRDDVSPDIYAQCYASDGTPLDSNFRVNDDTLTAMQGAPSVATEESGNFVITWVDYRSGNDDIYAQRFTANGTAIAGNFRVDDDTTTTGVYSPSIATHGSGDFVITWTDGRNGWEDIYAQRYASDGTALGGNFRANDDLPGAVRQAVPSVAALKSGSFLIAWQDPRNGWEDIYAQRYASDGAPLDSNFRLTNTGYLMQWSPDVKLWNDRIYSTWTDHRAGGTEFDIWANVLDWHNPVGISDDHPYQITSTILLRQNCPNPFNPATSISYSISRAASVRLAIHDASGRLVRRLISGYQAAGEHCVPWDGRDEYGWLVSSGVYFYTLEVGTEDLISKKMLLLR